jgi:hypothetical protein
MYANLPFPPPHPARSVPCLASKTFLVYLVETLRGKVTGKNYPFTPDLVLALAVLRLFNWSFDFWIELVIEFAKLSSQAIILFCKTTLSPRVLLNGRVVAL